MSTPSPSVRRAWIEIISSFFFAMVYPSPSVRRAWIEIILVGMVMEVVLYVTLREEGVD